MGMAESAIGFPNFFYCANRTSGLLTYLVVLPLWIQKKEPFVLGRPLARPLFTLGRLAAWLSIADCRMMMVVVIEVMMNAVSYHDRHV